MHSRASMRWVGLVLVAGCPAGASEVAAAAGAVVAQGTEKGTEISFEELFSRLPEAERIAAVEKLAGQGIFMGLPEYLRADIGSVAKRSFLRTLSEPLDERMLRTIDEVSAAETDDRLRLAYRVVLYRHGYDEARARDALVAELAGARRQEAALILCLNRDTEALVAVVAALEHEAVLDDELLYALGEFGHPQAGKFLARRFGRARAQRALLLALALSGRRTYYAAALERYENEKLRGMRGIARLDAAAAAALMGDEEQAAAAITFLEAQLAEENPPFQLWPEYALRALAWCKQEQAVAALRRVALGEVSEHLRRESLAPRMSALAAVGLCRHIGTPAGEAALVVYLETGDGGALDTRERTRVIETVLRSRSARAKELLRQKFPDEDWAKREKIAGLKPVPDEFRTGR